MFPGGPGNTSGDTKRFAQIMKALESKLFVLPDDTHVYPGHGNDTTLGHRRWILHPPLGPIGIGFYGDASCLGVFGMSGGGTSGDWYSYPPTGAVPKGLEPRPSGSRAV